MIDCIGIYKNKNTNMFDSVESFSSYIESNNPLDEAKILEVKTWFESLNHVQKAEVIKALEISRKDHLALREELAPWNMIPVNIDEFTISTTGMPQNSTNPTISTVIQTTPILKTTPIVATAPMVATVPIANTWITLTPEQEIAPLDWNLFIWDLPDQVTPNMVEVYVNKIILQWKDKAQFTNKKFHKLLVEYQEWRNLNVWKIWAYTYAELLTESYYDDNKLREFARDWINEQEQKMILNLFKYADHGSYNIEKLTGALLGLKAKLSNTPDYDIKYRTFFDQLDTSKQEFLNSDAGILVVQEREENFQSIYAIMKDDSKTLPEKMKAILSKPALILPWVLLFLFWVFGWNTKYTNSFWKRIWWVIWWALFGPALWNELWGNEILADAKDYWTKKKKAQADLRAITSTGNPVSPTTAISQVRSDESSELYRAFPEASSLEAVNEKFKTDETLPYIRISDIWGIITELEKWDTGNVPNYIKNISVSGKTLTTEQLIIYLSSLQTIWQDHDKVQYIRDIFELQSTSTTAWIWAWLWLLALWGIGLLTTTPLIITWAAAWTALAWGLSLMFPNAIWDYIASSTHLQKNIDTLDAFFASIKDPQVLGQVIRIFESGDIESQITNLQQLQRANPNAFTVQQMNEFLDAKKMWHIRAQITELQAISGMVIINSVTPLDIITPENTTAIQDRITALNNFAESISNPLERWVIETEIAELQSNFEVKLAEARAEQTRQQEANEQEADKKARERKKVLPSEIDQVQEQILKLKDEKNRLETERLSASAERIQTINTRLALIPVEIAELEANKTTLEQEQEEVKVRVANLDVKLHLPVITSNIEFLENEFAEAIRIQWITWAVENNITRLAGYAEYIFDKRDKIEFADIPEKQEFAALLTELETQLQEIRVRYIEANPQLGSIDADDIQWFDFFNPANMNMLNSIFESPTQLHWVGEFIWTADGWIQRPEILKLTYSSEFARQIAEKLNALYDFPVDNISNLKREVEEVNKYYDAYENIFWQSANREAFQQVTRSKNAALLSMNYSDILISETKDMNEVFWEFIWAVNLISSEDAISISNILVWQDSLHALIQILKAISTSWSKYKDPTSGDIVEYSLKTRELTSTFHNAIETELTFLNV